MQTEQTRKEVIFSKIKSFIFETEWKKMLITFLKNNWQHFIATALTWLIIPSIFLFFYLSFLQRTPIPKREHTPTDTYFEVLQITDTHFRFNQTTAQRRMKKFCNLFPKLTPEAVVVTGDIGHKRVSGTNEPAHFREEYEYYNTSVTECLKKYPTVWYDIRGNHDADGVYGRKDARNYAFSVLRGNAHLEEVGHRDLKKDNHTLRIIGLDTFGEAHVVYEAEGTVKEETVDKIAELATEENTYNLLALHKTMNEVLTTKGRYMMDELAVKMKNVSTLTLTVFGHHHVHIMSAYQKGFIQSKPPTFQRDMYNQLVFKNHVGYYKPTHLNSIPIIPLCPGENVNRCKYTEVYVGMPVDNVYVTSLVTNETFELTAVDKKVWKADKIIDGNIEVIITSNGVNTTETFNFGYDFKQKTNWKMYMRMSRVAIVASLVAFTLLVARLIGALLAKWIPTFKKVGLFEHYAHVPTVFLIIGVIAAIGLHYVPLLISNHSFHDGIRDVKIFGGANGVKIGDYRLPFFCHGYALYFSALMIMWCNFWTVAHFLAHNFLRGLIGFFSTIVVLGMEMRYLYLLGMNAMKCSPVLYLTGFFIGIQAFTFCYTLYRVIKESRQKNNKSYQQQPLEEDIEIPL